MVEDLVAVTTWRSTVPVPVLMAAEVEVEVTHKEGPVLA